MAKVVSIKFITKDIVELVFKEKEFSLGHFNYRKQEGIAGYTNDLGCHWPGAIRISHIIDELMSLAPILSVEELDQHSIKVERFNETEVWRWSEPLTWHEILGQVDGVDLKALVATQFVGILPNETFESRGITPPDAVAAVIAEYNIGSIMDFKFAEYILNKLEVLTLSDFIGENGGWYNSIFGGDEGWKMYCRARDAFSVSFEQ